MAACSPPEHQQVPRLLPVARPRKRSGPGWTRSLTCARRPSSGLDAAVAQCRCGRLGLVSRRRHDAGDQSSGVVPSRRLDELDRDFRFDLSRRLLETSSSATERASRRLDREFRFARRAGLSTPSASSGSARDSARTSASSRSRRSLTSRLRECSLRSDPAQRLAPTRAPAYRGEGACSSPQTEQARRLGQLLLAARSSGRLGTLDQTRHSPKAEVLH